MKVWMKNGPLKGKKFDGLLALMDAQATLRSACKHLRRFRRIEHGSNHRFAWIRVRCTRCQDCLEYHQTPKLVHDVPD